ncbi:MAG: hypothetical protein K1X88_01110 [Nannocystaceae bacterium]|nr:hypothetical protein [Nannocystaceae bacterium]
MNTRLRRPLALAATLSFVACQDPGPGGGFAGEIEFKGELGLLPGFDFDSGFLPADSPVAVRATATADGAITVSERATTDGQALMPVAGSGALAITGGLAFELSARIDVTGAEFEGVVDSFEYALQDVSQAFEPFADATPATAMTMLPPAELGSVPIPGVPGATLVVEVTGGSLTTQYHGTCAATRDGFGAVAGTLTTSGTVTLAASVEIDIPFVLTETFGPFPVDVAIPEVPTAMDLGTRSLQTGEPADAMGICEGGGGSDGGSDGIAEGSGDGSSGAASSDGPGSDGSDTSGGADSSGSATDAGTDTTEPTTGGGTPSDPDYPNPSPDGCPAQDVAVAIGDQSNGVCLPPCGADDSCPSGASGSAVGGCLYNPESSYAACVGDGDCTPGETCIDGVCQLPPNFCVLGCDDTAICPDGMDCITGVCTYPQ